jgi:hypothetical protein
VIKVMKEQLSAVRYQLAAADDALRRFKCNEYAEVLRELKGVKTAGHIAREDNKVKDLRIKQLEVEVEDLTNALRSYEDYQRQLEVDRCRGTAPIDEDRRSPYGSLSEHTPRMNKRGAESASKDKLSLANNRLLSLLRKLEKSELARRQLEERNKRLEGDRKKLMLKWQNSLQRFKNEEQSKPKLRSSETAVAYKDRDRAALEEQYKEAVARLTELQVARSQEAALFTKAEETNRRLQMQRRQDEEEITLLKRINQGLTYRASLQEAELAHCKQDAAQQRGLIQQNQSQQPAEPLSCHDNEPQEAQRSQSLSGILRSLVHETERPILSVIPERRAVTPQRTQSVMHGGNSYSSLTRSPMKHFERSSLTPPPRKLRYSPITNET